MRLVAILRDNQPIRTCCFSHSGDHFVLGTNSKSLKICRLPKNGQDLNEDVENESSGDYYNHQKVEDIQVVME